MKLIFFADYLVSNRSSNLLFIFYSFACNVFIVSMIFMDKKVAAQLFGFRLFSFSLPDRSRQTLIEVLHTPRALRSGDQGAFENVSSSVFLKGFCSCLYLTCLRTSRSFTCPDSLYTFAMLIGISRSVFSPSLLLRSRLFPYLSFRRQPQLTGERISPCRCHRKVLLSLVLKLTWYSTKRARTTIERVQTSSILRGSSTQLCTAYVTAV